MSHATWGTDFAALARGEGCPMCEPGADETPHGVRLFEGRWSDAYLGRFPVRPGYAYVIWKGRHVAEPTELTDEETAGFWREVAHVARGVTECSRPVKMNWLSLGNGVPTCTCTSCRARPTTQGRADRWRARPSTGTSRPRWRRTSCARRPTGCAPSSTLVSP